MFRESAEFLTGSMADASSASPAFLQKVQIAHHLRTISSVNTAAVTLPLFLFARLLGAQLIIAVLQYRRHASFLLLALGSRRVRTALNARRTSS